jgi:acyl-CoA thioester hydrolase
MRIRISFPQPFCFTTFIPVRISDINYGGHVGNDSILSIIHEARLNYLKQWNYDEMNAGGHGLIMADSAIQYKGEAFYGDEIRVDICVGDVSSISFDLFYKMTTQRNNTEIVIAFVKTGMICFDYSQRKITQMTDEFHQKITSFKKNEQ